MAKVTKLGEDHDRNDRDCGNNGCQAFGRNTEAPSAYEQFGRFTHAPIPFKNRE